MPPPPVFSYLRGHHRRTGSTPTSPQTSQPPKPPSPQWNVEMNKVPPPYRFGAAPSPSSASPISPLPPTLPSIRRVSSNRKAEKESLSPPYDDGEISESPATANSDMEKPVFHLELGQSDSTPDQQSKNFLGVPPPQHKHQQQQSHQMQQPQLYSNVNNKPFASSRYYSNDRVATPASYNRSRNEQQNALPTHLNPRAPSPSSSFSSFQRSSTSTYIGTESSPSSSRSIQQPVVVSNTKASKSKINLLNPVSLLMRRRASQNPTATQDDAPVIHKTLDVPAMNLPKDYDPRIRGKVVHDFNAPRPKVASPDATATTDISTVEQGLSSFKDSISSTSRDNTMPTSIDQRRSPERDRAPLFTEHFDENQTTETADSDAVRRESLANPMFLARMSRHLDLDSQSDPPSSSIKPISSDTPPAPPSGQNGPSERTSKGTESTSYRDSSDHSTARSSISNDTRATSPPQSPTKESPSRSSLTGPEASFQPAGLPKHLSSTASRASRFSFQLNSDRSIAQEKALEEKHIQKTMANNMKPESVAESQYENSDMDDDMIDMDDMGDDDFEERIPGINAEEDYDEYQDQYKPSISNDWHTSNGGVAVSDFGMGNDISLSPNQEGVEFPVPPSERLENVSNDFTPTMGVMRENTNSSFVSDDMYFDDGLIEEPTSSVAQDFDESVFDSPVKSRFEQKDGRIWNLTQGMENGTTNVDFATNEVKRNGFLKDHRSDSGSQSGNEMMEATVAYQASPQTRLKPQRISIPPRDIDKYHSALATAAIQAEAAGKFYRKNSLESEIISPESDFHTRGPPSVPETASDFQEDENNPLWSGEQDDFDNLEDDPMVAEANAEALAADDSGFYGREFGFYGSSAGDEEMYNGGFFGVPGADGLNRSMSGHNASREPNLTPITERSEFSTRNSFISLTALGGPGGAHVMRPQSQDQSLPNPGLKELASRIGLDDEELSLGQLLKLRKETFGGSTGSLGSFGGGSAASSPSTSFSSPLAMGPHPMIHPPPLPHAQGTEIVEEHPFEEDEDFSGDFEDRSNYHTLGTYGLAQQDLLVPMGSNRPFSSNETTPKAPTNNAQNFQQQTPPPPTPHFYVSPRDPPNTTFRGNTQQIAEPTVTLPMPSNSMVQKFSARPQASSETFLQRSRPRHQRNSHGGSDSVTYVQEPDETGEMRWYMERRRTMLNGEVVVVGRELVEGGTI